MASSMSARVGSAAPVLRNWRYVVVSAIPFLRLCSPENKHLRKSGGFSRILAVKLVWVRDVMVELKRRLKAKIRLKGFLCTEISSIFLCGLILRYFFNKRSLGDSAEMINLTISWHHSDVMISNHLGTMDRENSPLRKLKLVTLVLILATVAKTGSCNLC